MTNHPLDTFMSSLFRIDEEEGVVFQPVHRNSFAGLDTLRQRPPPQHMKIQIVADNAKSFQPLPLPQRSQSEGKKHQCTAALKQTRIEDLKIKESRWESGSITQPLVQCRRRSF